MLESITKRYWSEDIQKVEVKPHLNKKNKALAHSALKELIEAKMVDLQVITHKYRNGREYKTYLVTNCTLQGVPLAKVWAEIRYDRIENPTL